jgi:hypothetical protein
MFLIVICALSFSGCRRKIGWGVVLWAQTEAGIPSGAVLPVYVRSNIEKKWIAGLPRQYRQPDSGINMVEIPLAQLHLMRTKWSAASWSRKNMGEYALSYAETLQDGLPIRNSPENGSQRVYRLRSGEVVKIMHPVDGVPAVGASGDPLPGQWFNVLTEDGTRGYCFSYRLRLFNHTTGGLGGGGEGGGDATDTALDAIVAKKWSAAEYWNMINENKIAVEDLEKQWGFLFGEDTGIANIYVSTLDRSFRYTGIRSEGGLRWRFEGTSLRFEQLGENQIKVEFKDDSAPGGGASFMFYALPVTIKSLIADEEERRESVYQSLYTKSPAFSSGEYGELYLTENRDFVWENFQALSPEVIPVSAMGRGKIDICYFLSNEFLSAYDGVLTFKFATVNGPMREVNFMYRFTPGGILLKHTRPTSMQGRVIVRLDTDTQEINFTAGVPDLY